MKAGRVRRLIWRVLHGGATQRDRLLGGGGSIRWK